MFTMMHDACIVIEGYMATYIVTLISGIYFADVITGRNATVAALLL